MTIINLIKLEFAKYKNNSLIQMLLLFFTILMPTSIFVLKKVDIPLLPGAGSFFSFPYLWEYQAYAGSWLAFFFLGYMGVYSITSEIQFKTMRQNIITGMTRNEFFAAKILSGMAISLYATLLFFVSTAIIGLAHQETFDVAAMLKGQQYVILRFFLLSFGYFSFGLMAGYVIRKPGLSLFFYVSYVIFIEPLILRWGLHNKLLGGGKSIFFYPMNAIEDLAPLPFFKYAKNFAPKSDYFTLLTYTEATVISVICITVFLGVSYLLFKKRDI